MKKLITILVLLIYCITAGKTFAQPLLSNLEGIKEWASTGSLYNRVLSIDYKERDFKLVSRGFYSSRTATELAIYESATGGLHLCVFFPQRDGFIFGRINEAGVLECFFDDEKGRKPQSFFSFPLTNIEASARNGSTVPPARAEFAVIKTWAGRGEVKEFSFPDQTIFIASKEAPHNQNRNEIAIYLGNGAESILQVYIADCTRVSACEKINDELRFYAESSTHGDSHVFTYKPILKIGSQ